MEAEMSEANESPSTCDQVFHSQGEGKGVRDEPLMNTTLKCLLLGLYTGKPQEEAKSFKFANIASSNLRATSCTRPLLPEGNAMVHRI